MLTNFTRGPDEPHHCCVRSEFDGETEIPPYPVQKVSAGIVFYTRRENINHGINAIRCA